MTPKVGGRVMGRMIVEIGTMILRIDYQYMHSGISRTGENIRRVANGTLLGSID
jgi:hypothetical protein